MLCGECFITGLLAGKQRTFEIPPTVSLWYLCYVMLLPTLQSKKHCKNPCLTSKLRSQWSEK